MKTVRFDKVMVDNIETWRRTYSDGTMSYGRRIRSRFGHYLPNTVSNPEFKRRIDTAITAQGIRAARKKQQETEQ